MSSFYIKLLCYAYFFYNEKFSINFLVLGTCREIVLWPIAFGWHLLLFTYVFVLISFQGPENQWLLEAFASSVPRPCAGVFAQEVFDSRVIPSETDFRIFRDFGHIPGNLRLIFQASANLFHIPMQAFRSLAFFLEILRFLY